ncbi:MAG: hypothetical protein AB1634_18450 [Thermodesulfobacteriota bacterium]
MTRALARLTVLLLASLGFAAGCRTLPPAPPITDQGFQDLQALVRQQPDNPDLHLSLASAYMTVFQQIRHPQYLDEAIAEALTARRLRPTTACLCWSWAGPSSWPAKPGLLRLVPAGGRPAGAGAPAPGSGSGARRSG